MLWSRGLALKAPLLLTLGLSLAWLSGCEEKQRPAFVGHPPSSSDAAEGGQAGSASGPSNPSSGGNDACPEPEPIDTSDLCDDRVIAVTVRKPNLYFLLDVSASMAEPITSRASTSKLEASKKAITRVVQDRGPRLNYGLAAFPSMRGSHPEEECNPGREVFEVTPGDPLICGKPQKSGPVLDALTSRLLSLRAGGGTPLSPSLKTLAPDLLSLPGETALIVLTDGAPNCNPEADCKARDCSLSLYGERIGDIECSLSVNCCDEAVVGNSVLDPGTYCFDRDMSVEQVANLHDAGISTFVVGVPGADDFDDLMNDLAEAGGTARNGTTKYFDVRDDDELDTALDEISQAVALPCTLELDDAPDGSTLLNVYLDKVLIKAETPDGWTFEDGKVTLLGESCSLVQGGEVSEITVVSGCGTILK
jgi:hypothetical protein